VRELVTGPSGAGKTRYTARRLREWVDANGPEAVVALDFAPEVERGGRVLGGRLTRFLDVPTGVRYEAIDARAPRAESDDDRGVLALAAANGRRARRALAAVERDRPAPRAAFVNDATIPFHHPDVDRAALLAYLDGADLSVCNAFDGEELGTDDPVSRAERRALTRLRGWADRERRL
jgi:hypothetical protein